MKVQRQTHDIALYREDTVWEELVVLDTDDVIYDLTGFTAAAQIRTQVDGAVVLDLDVTITDAAVGEVLVQSPTPTTDLDLGPDDAGVWDLQILSADATPLIFTAFVGGVTFTKDVTNP